MTVTHRVVGVSKNGLEIKGDASDKTDSTLVTWENYRGKVLFIIPYLGYAVLFLRTKAAIALVAVALTANFVMKILKKISSLMFDLY